MEKEGTYAVKIIMMYTAHVKGVRPLLPYIHRNTYVGMISQILAAARLSIEARTRLGKLLSETRP